MPAWCRDNRLEDSDSLQVWIDTRNTQSIHRASRFCHRFIFLPAGGGRQYAEPVADQLLIDRTGKTPGRFVRARYKFAPPCGPTVITCRHSCRLALTGYEPDEHPRLGFTYRLFDREFGEQTFSALSDFPFASDPSLWATLELVS